VAGVERDAPGINDTYSIEIVAPVLVEERLFSDGLSNDANTILWASSARVGPVKETLDGRVFHEINLYIQYSNRLQSVS